MMAIVKSPLVQFMLMLAITVMTGAVALAADPQGATFTDPAQAGADHETQGEYAGVVPSTDGQDRKVGVQVIALGDGKFRAVVHVGGLPGAGWSRGDVSHTVESQRENGTVEFASDDGELRGVIEDGAFCVYRNDEKIADLPKVERKSPTLEAKPPAGAVVLFDGTSTDLWKNGELVEGKWLGATNVSTIQKFGDHKLHLEFRTPFMPEAREQQRGNSGVYLQSRYEVQVLDSFGLEGADNECGGIYKVSRPAVNMCFPPLAWQTYDIDFTAARYDDQGKKTKNARITVSHNGVVIHKDVELPDATAAGQPEQRGPEGLFLQNHGNPVVFRNIWAVEK